MATSERKTNRVSQFGSWQRRYHRGLGAVVAVFVLFLSCTGIALNHSSDWNLDDRYVVSDWLLDVYGVRAPSASASFADSGHRVTLLGQRLYLDDQQIAEDIDALTGMVSLDTYLLVTASDQALLFTTDGELVERMDLSAQLPGPVERIGRAGERAVISSRGLHYLANADVTGFEPCADSILIDTTWSASSAAPESLLNSLRAQYRGRGLSVERLIADIHSGRVVTIAGPYLMDAVAILLIVLSITGIVLWMRPRKPRRL